MKTNACLIWDLPTRIFHWLLTAGFIAAAMIALLTGRKSSLFPYHAVIGLALALMVALRVIWGFIGTRHARFGFVILAAFYARATLAEPSIGGGAFISPVPVGTPSAAKTLHPPPTYYKEHRTHEQSRVALGRTRLVGKVVSNILRHLFLVAQSGKLLEVENT